MNFLSEKRTEIDERLRELEPLYSEYLMLERAKAALEGIESPAEPNAGRARGGQRPRRRQRRGGTTEAVIAWIGQHPGATVREIADGIGLKHPNYLYRVLPTLEERGVVRREGRGWQAV